VKNNGITWRKIGAVQKSSAGLEWEAWTKSWLHRDWDGVINPPFCQHCGHRNEELPGSQESLPDITSPHYESLRGMLLTLGASIEELSARYKPQAQGIECENKEDPKQGIDEIGVKNNEIRRKRRRVEHEV
jgi:hypothetical protein